MRATAAMLAMMLAILVFEAPDVYGQEVEIGVIRNASGAVTINRNGATVPAVVGESILNTDIIETGPDGSIGFILADSSQFSLGPGTEFHLQEFEFEPLQQNYLIFARILRGTLVFVSGDIGRLSPEDVHIEIPWGVIGLRGTRLAVAVDPQ